MNQKRNNTPHDVLPTIKRICTEDDELTFSQGKTYEKNGLILKHKLTNLKIKNLVATFARKIRRNLTNSKPVHFQLKSSKDYDEQRLIKWSGWQIEDRLQGFILFMDIIMSLATYFIAAFQGFLDGFKNGAAASPPILILKLISMVIFAIRLILALITIDYEDDTLYFYITDIVKKQFKGGDILLHIFQLVMVLASLVYPNNETVGIIFFFSSFFKLALIRSNLKILQLRFIDSIKKFYIWNLIRVVIFDIIFAHTIAAVLLAVSRINPDENWILVKLVNNNLADPEQTWYVVYFWSYYWACTIMMTIGFGDISPVDYRESIVIAFIQIFSSIVLAYNISEVGSIVSSMRKSSQSLQRKLGIMRRMLKKNPIPQELECKIESYLTHEIEIKDRFQYNQHRSIIDQLPQQLKQQYFHQSNHELYSTIPLFRYFQKDCLSKLNRAFEGKVFYPGQFIVKYRIGCDKIIIMKSGQFGLAYWKPRSSMNGTVVQSIKLQQDSHEGALITTSILSRGKQLNYDIVSLTYSYGMQMNVEVFLSILKESNLDYYYYKSVVDKHEKEPNPYEYITCEYCDEYHTKFQCTKLHYIPSKSQRYLKQRNYNSHPVERNTSFYRKMRSHFKGHCHTIWKNFFLPIKNALVICHDDPNMEDHWNVDQPYDFFMYFKEYNPANFKNQKMCKSRWSLMFTNNILQKLQSNRTFQLSSSKENIY